MRREFRESDVTGVLPLLLLTLSRSGYTIEDVTPIAIIADGSMVPMAPRTRPCWNPDRPSRCTLPITAFIEH